MAAFSVITLSSLWFFSIRYLELAQAYSSQGLPFATSAQVGYAAFGTVVALPALVATLYLSTRAIRLPFSLFRRVRAAGEHWTLPTHLHHAAFPNLHCPACSREFPRLPDWSSHLRLEHGF